MGNRGGAQALCSAGQPEAALRSDQREDEDMIRSIEPGKDALAVTWQKGSTSRFPFIWLRDNCRCAKCRDPRNGQRLFDTLDLPADPQPTVAKVDGDAISIRWAGEDHDSHYASAWLAAHDLSPKARAERRSRHQFWGAEIANGLPQADWPAVLANPAEELRLLTGLSDYGFALLHKVPTEPGQVAAVGDRLGHVRVTN